MSADAARVRMLQRTTQPLEQDARLIMTLMLTYGYPDVAEVCDHITTTANELKELANEQ